MRGAIDFGFGARALFDRSLDQIGSDATVLRLFLVPRFDGRCFEIPQT
jgi:hypothetical protein